MHKKQNDNKMKALTNYHSQLLDDKLFGDSPLKKGGCGLVNTDLMN